MGTSKKMVRINHLWTNTLLERLSTQLSTRTSNLEQAGEPTKKACPDHYSYDIVIPLVAASEHVPLGWILFGAKYMQDENFKRDLRDHVVRQVAEFACSAALAELVVESYCDGQHVSGRDMRRRLDVGRAEGSQYQALHKSFHAHFHAVEENYARIVRMFL